MEPTDTDGAHGVARGADRRAAAGLEARRVRCRALECRCACCFLEYRYARISGHSFHSFTPGLSGSLPSADPMYFAHTGLERLGRTSLRQRQQRAISLVSAWRRRQSPHSPTSRLNIFSCLSVQDSFSWFFQDYWPISSRFCQTSAPTPSIRTHLAA